MFHQNEWSDKVFHVRHSLYKYYLSLYIISFLRDILHKYATDTKFQGSYHVTCLTYP